MNTPGFSEAALSGMRKVVSLMETHGATCTLREFQESVNLAFHRHEAAVYDHEHERMWKSLPPVFEALATAVAKTLKEVPSLRLLDVGCGTGLSSTLLLQTCLGKKISSVTLVDTSPEMLARAQKRLQCFQRPIHVHEGELDRLDADEGYDVVLTCSVLHHIPDLEDFLRSIRRVVAPGGVFVNAHDPNGDYLGDRELGLRKERLAAEKMAAMRPGLAGRIAGKIRRSLKETDYIALVNRDLLDQRIISTPLTDTELWTVTDIHVENGAGISLKFIGSQLASFDPVFACSYHFFGKMSSELPAAFREEERHLFASGAMNGQEVAAVWHKPESAPIRMPDTHPDIL